MFILYVFKKNYFCHIRRVYNSPANFRYSNRISINSILFLLTQSLVQNWPIRTYHKRYHIKAHLYFHYPNRHDLPNWTIVYSTIEIGHRTLDPPASNRKSVLFPIVQKRKSILSIIYKCRQSAVYRLFFVRFRTVTLSTCHELGLLIRHLLKPASLVNPHFLLQNSKPVNSLP